MNRKIFYLIFACCGVLLFPREWVIDDIHIESNGMTRESSLLRVSELREGTRFESEKELANALEVARNTLYGYRIFDSVQITKEILSEENEEVRVRINILTEDTWNIIALPYPKYDSNTGFLFSLRGRDYNFLGLMEKLALDLNYQYDDTDADHVTNNFDIGLNYVFNFTIAEQSYALKAYQNFYYKPDDDQDIFFMRTGLNISTYLTLPWDIYSGNKPDYGFGLSGGRNYTFDSDGISDERNDLELGAFHFLSLGWVKWGENNYRDGLNFELRNDWGLNLDDEISWDGSLSGTVQFHKDFYPFGYSARAYVKHNINDNQTNAGGPLRGILNRNIQSRTGLYMNHALYITVWNDENFWEIMGGPCLDVGYTWDIPEEQDPLQWSIAVEGLCYPAFAKSFQARITIGFDAGGIARSEREGFDRYKDNMALFFGLGTFY